MTVYIPFGDHCGPATILKQSKLRVESLPFDWVFALPEYIKDSLDTNFEKWFDLSSLTYIKRENGSILTQCLAYPINSDSEGFFNHHNLTDLEVQEAFKRRVQRFKDLISSDEHIVFLTTSSQKLFNEYGLFQYFNRDAKTDFVFLEWQQQSKNIVKPYLNNGYLSIKYGCEDKLSNPTVSKAIGDILRSLD